jgi:hypothetical protein
VRLPGVSYAAVENTTNGRSKRCRALILADPERVPTAAVHLNYTAYQ